MRQHIGSVAELLKELSYNTVRRGVYVPTGTAGINIQGLKGELMGSHNLASE